MFKHKVEVWLYFVPTGRLTKNGKPETRPVVTRTLYLTDDLSPKTNITRYKVVVTTRKVGEDDAGNAIRATKFSAHYWPPHEREAWWEKFRQLRTGWQREKEPDGKPSSYDLQGILEWLSLRVEKPVEVMQEFLTTPPKRKGDEDEGSDELAA